MNILEQIIKLLERVYGKGVISKNIGTRTNVVRFPKGPQGLDPTTRHFDVEGTAQKNPDLVNIIKNSIEDRIPDLSKMNDQELLNYKQNLQRLADHIDPPSAEIIKAGSKQRVTGEGLEKLIKEQGTKYSPTTEAGQLEATGKKLQKLSEDFSKEFSPENLAKQEADRQALIAKQYEGKGYAGGVFGPSGMYRSVARDFLLDQNAKGKIKLNPETVKALEERSYISGGQPLMYPDPIRVMRYHYGDDIFEKIPLDKIPTGAKSEIIEAMSKVEAAPVKIEAPKTPGGYLTPGEYKANIEEMQNIENMIKRRESRFADMTEEEIQNELAQYGGKRSSFEMGLEYDYPEEYAKYKGPKKPEPEEKADGGSIGLDYLMGIDNRPKYAGGGDVKKILDLIAKANKELKGKKSMEVINPKTGEVTIPKNPIKVAETAERKPAYYDVREEFDKLKTKHKIAAAAHDELPSIDLYDKISPDRLAEVMAEMKGKDFFDLPQKQKSDYYKKAQNYIDDLRRIDRTSKAVEKFNSGAELGVVDKQYLNKLKQVDLSDITQPQYTEVGGKKVLDATHPDTIQSFSDFAKASDPEGYAQFSKKVDRINELSTMRRNQKRFEQYDLEDYKKLDSTRINELLNDIKNPSSFLEEERNIVTNAAGKGLKNHEDVQFKVDKEKLQSHLEDLLKEKQLEEAQVELGQLKKTGREPNAKGGQVGIDYLLGL